MATKSLRSCERSLPSPSSRSSREIASFEWSLAESFDSADEAVLGRAALASVEPAEWADVTFRFHPSVRRLAFEWNTTAVWKALSAEEASPAPERSADPVEYLIWRRDLENYFRSLDPAEVTALDAAREGCNFAQVCAALAQHLPEGEVPLRAASLIATWLDGGLLAGLAR